ncbi:DoxX family membrane protein [Spiribacter sp. 2438]|uniref:DoxX family membrane protein n=1 Tax=Spiribacter sp. 2438 TaxID=2666185 RepID=UPI0018A1D12A|nr:DoxX family membrane protein [Spiribacter sp. 2438]
MGAPLDSGDAILDRQAAQSHWLLRTPLAAVLVYHGLEKWLGTGVGAFAEAMNFPLGLVVAVVVLELMAGLLLLAGALTNDWITRLGAALACPVLLGAIFLVHWGQWHFLPSASHPMGGMAFQVTLLCLSIYLLIRGNQT